MIKPLYTSSQRSSSAPKRVNNTSFFADESLEPIDGELHLVPYVRLLKQEDSRVLRSLIPRKPRNDVSFFADEGLAPIGNEDYLIAFEQALEPKTPAHAVIECPVRALRCDGRTTPRRELKLS
jgi:hypothetical protein